MEIIQIEKKLIQTFDSLFKTYELSTNIAEEGLGIALIKKNTDVLFNIRGFINFKNLSYSSFTAGFTISSIEDTIQPILIKFLGRGLYQPEFSNTLSIRRFDKNYYEQTKIPQINKEIKSDKDILNLLKELKKYTEEIAEPFFYKWSDLRAINDFFDIIPQKEVGQYFGLGASLKKALVYKLCKNPNFENYFEKLYGYYTKRYIANPNGDESLKKWNDAVIELKEILNKIEPIYNLEV